MQINAARRCQIKSKMDQKIFRKIKKMKELKRFGMDGIPIVRQLLIARWYEKFILQ